MQNSPLLLIVIIMLRAKIAVLFLVGVFRMALSPLDWEARIPFVRALGPKPDVFLASGLFSPPRLRLQLSNGKELLLSANQVEQGLFQRGPLLGIYVFLRTVDRPESVSKREWEKIVGHFVCKNIPARLKAEFFHQIKNIRSEILDAKGNWSGVHEMSCEP